VHWGECGDILDECLVEPAVLGEEDVSDMTGVFERRPRLGLGSGTEQLETTWRVEERAEALSYLARSVSYRSRRVLCGEILLDEATLLA
jgi:hypothetical protein